MSQAAKVQSFDKGNHRSEIIDECELLSDSWALSRRVLGSVAPWVDVSVIVYVVWEGPPYAPVPVSGAGTPVSPTSRACGNPSRVLVLGSP